MARLRDVQAAQAPRREPRGEGPYCCCAEAGQAQATDAARSRYLTQARNVAYAVGAASALIDMASSRNSLPLSSCLSSRAAAMRSSSARQVCRRLRMLR